MGTTRVFDSGRVDPADLIEGDLKILGLLPASSNYTFLARLQGGAGELVVYKPRKGETPLWDFWPGTLCQREVAAYLTSAAAGWTHVPPTVLRDGPLGPGAVQLFIRHDPAVTAFDLLVDHGNALRRIALFDLVVNNADRKAGHVFIDDAGQIWGVDHGLCFHEQPKLRTVLWDFIGEPIPEEALQLLGVLIEAMKQDLAGELSPLLGPGELKSLAARAERLLREKIFPPPGPGRPYPWPPI